MLLVARGLRLMLRFLKIAPQPPQLRLRRLQLALHVEHRLALVLDSIDALLDGGRLDVGRLFLRLGQRTRGDEQHGGTGCQRRHPPRAAAKRED